MAAAAGVKRSGVAQQSEAGLALFKEEKEVEGDADAAKAFKDETDDKIAALKVEADALTGKDNKKARTEKEKEMAALKTTEQYIDATRVLKGQPPKNGHFAKAGSEKKPEPEEPKPAAAPAAAATAEGDTPAKKEKEGKKPSKVESAGISKAERDELEKLKTSIVELKTKLKAEGMSGGQMNKDERVVAMVTRMNVLKEKENPGATAKEPKKEDAGKKKGGKSPEQEAEIAELKQQIETYRTKLVDEFKYAKKEINADPEMMELLQKLVKAET